LQVVGSLIRPPTIAREVPSRNGKRP